MDGHVVLQQGERHLHVREPALLTGVLRDDWGFDGLVMTDWFGGRDAVRADEGRQRPVGAGHRPSQETLLAAVECGPCRMTSSTATSRGSSSSSDGPPTFLDSAPVRRARPPGAREARARRRRPGHGAAAERRRTLPLRPRRRRALFGDTSYDMITGGTGSGDVNEAYTISIVEGLKAAGFAVDASLADGYAAFIAEEEKSRPPERRPVPCRCRPSPRWPWPPKRTRPAWRGGRRGPHHPRPDVGRVRDRSVEGDFELTDVETAPDRRTSPRQPSTRGRRRARGRLNIGGVIETVSWRDLADAILLGLAARARSRATPIADVLAGKTPPSGRLATTFPILGGRPLVGPLPGHVGRAPTRTPRWPLPGRPWAEVEYDDDVFVGYRHFATRGVTTAYPFGFGLSYTPSTTRA